MVRAYSPDLNVRVACVDATAAAEEARRRHQSMPLATVALARAVTGALLMGSSLKGNQRVGLQYKGNGPLKEIYADADGEGNVRGYVVNPKADLPLRDGRFDVAAGIGLGYLNVTTDLGLRNTYQGVVALESGEMALDLANYLSQSAQIPSVVSLGAYVEGDGRVGAAGGFLVQAMPGATPEVLTRLEANILGLPVWSAMAKDGLEPEDIVQRILAGHGFEVLSSEAVRYRCRCSRERVERTLLALGEDELRDMAATNHGAEVTCEFCSERYAFTEGDLLTLIERGRAA